MGVVVLIVKQLLMHKGSTDVLFSQTFCRHSLTGEQIKP